MRWGGEDQTKPVAAVYDRRSSKTTLTERRYSKLAAALPYRVNSNSADNVWWSEAGVGFTDQFTGFSQSL